VEIFLCHEPFRADNVQPPPTIIIHGHTHKPRNEMIDGVRWFNPGTAGKPQFDARDLTVGILTLNDGAVEAEILNVG
jgi:hypothetical protein